MAKTKNISIRLDEDHFKYAAEKTGIDNPQQLVDKVFYDLFTLGNPVKNVFDVPTLDKQTPSSKNYNNSTSTLSQFESYKSEISNADSLNELESIMKEVEKDRAIKFFEKASLKELAQIKATEFK